MNSKIKITLDSENREKNKIIINDADMTDCVTGIRIDWQADSLLPKVSIDFVTHLESYIK